MGNRTGCVNAKNRRTATGLFPGGSECSALGTSTNKFAPKRSSARRGRCRASRQKPSGRKKRESPAHYNAPTESGRIGRQAPVKRCLARFAGLASRVSNGKAPATAGAPTKKIESRANSQHAQKIATALAVGKHLLDAGHVRFIYQRELLQLAHAAGSFGAHQVALAGMPALDLAVRRELETLPGATVRFQFQFWFRSVSGHLCKSSRQLIRPLAAAGQAPPLQNCFPLRSSRLNTAKRDSSHPQANAFAGTKAEEKIGLLRSE